MRFETGVHERDIDPNEARESDFTMPVDLPGDDPIMSCLYRVLRGNR